jgi:hypothetical protein
MTVQWDKTQNTWHVDVGKVGRYSVQPVGLHVRGRGRLYGAFLNNERIAGVPSDHDVEAVKHHVEERIETARRINAEFAGTKVQVGTVDMTPTWGEVLSILLDFHAFGNIQQRDTAHRELVKMASAADSYNAMQREIKKQIALGKVALTELGVK